MFLDLLLEVWYVWRKVYFKTLCKFDAYKSVRGTESESFLCSASTDLRFSMALCDQEKLFMQARKDRVMLSIKKLLKMENPRFLPASPREVKSQTLNNCLINSAILKKVSYLQRHRSFLIAALFLDRFPPSPFWVLEVVSVQWLVSLVWWRLCMNLGCLIVHHTWQDFLDLHGQ